VALDGEHVLYGGNEVGGPIDKSLGVGRVWGARLVVGALTSLLSALSQGVKILVKGTGGYEAFVEETPSPSVSARIFIVLGESGTSGVEHRVVGKADGALEMPGGKYFACCSQTVTSLIHELL
jgi:hypothetical protein